DQGERRMFVLRRALQLLYAQRRYAEAVALIGKLPDTEVARADLGRLAAQITLANAGTGDTADLVHGRRQALEAARKAVGDSSKDYHDYLWLGQVAALADQPQEAEKAFRQARQLAATVPDTW